MTKQAINIHLTPEQVEALDAIAKAANRSRKNLIETILGDYIEQASGKPEQTTVEIAVIDGQAFPY